jgi:hypothetical protein
MKLRPYRRKAGSVAAHNSRYGPTEHTKDHLGPARRGLSTDPRSHGNPGDLSLLSSTMISGQLGRPNPEM